MFETGTCKNIFKEVAYVWLLVKTLENIKCRGVGNGYDKITFISRNRQHLSEISENKKDYGKMIIVLSRNQKSDFFWCHCKGYLKNSTGHMEEGLKYLPKSDVG